MTTPSYNLCPKETIADCGDATGCHLCVVTRDDSGGLQYVNPICSEIPTQHDWGIPLPEGPFFTSCPKPLSSSKCQNGGIYDIYSGKCICTPGYIGPECATPTQSCLGVECVSSKNSRDYECDQNYCKEQIINLPESEGTTGKDFIILAAILIVLFIPLVLIWLVKKFTSTKEIPPEKKK